MLTRGDTVAQALLAEESGAGEGHGAGGEGGGGLEGTLTSALAEPVVTAVVEHARRLLMR